MANNALKNLLTTSRRAGQELSPEQKKALTKALTIKGEKGKGKKITQAELKRGAKKSGQDFDDFLATVSATYGTKRFGGKVKDIFEKKGFEKKGGQYVKYDPLSQKDIKKAIEAGYSAGDIRKYIAKNFVESELGSQIGKFMGEGEYGLDASTGQWERTEPIEINTEGKLPNISTVSPGEAEGIFAGLDPDAFPGATPMEMEYAAIVDPYKIQAKSSERQQKLSALTNLRGQKIGQATSLYGLIPYAFR